MQRSNGFLTGLPGYPEAVAAQQGAERALFYRCSPLSKERIVQSLQELGHAVLFVGDGKNDVLELQAADVAVVVANGAPDAKECADVLLLGDLGAVAHVMRLGRALE